MSEAGTASQAALMDGIYRGQRHIYDLTRKYYLFGRDGLIEQLAAPDGATVIEIACGTGRNLGAIKRRWPGTAVHGLDISAEMLKSARAALGTGARLAQGDACRFDAPALFGRDCFDRVVLSYALSMIPDWERALQQAARLVAPGGSLHVVDFGSLEAMPAPLAQGLRGCAGPASTTSDQTDLQDLLALTATTQDRSSPDHGCCRAGDEEITTRGLSAVCHGV